MWGKTFWTKATSRVVRTCKQSWTSPVDSMCVPPHVTFIPVLWDPFLVLSQSLWWCPKVIDSPTALPGETDPLRQPLYWAGLPAWRSVCISASLSPAGKTKPKSNVRTAPKQNTSLLQLYRDHKISVAHSRGKRAKVSLWSSSTI